MRGVSTSLEGYVDQALKLPGIAEEACVHARFHAASCRACVEVCPRGAWQLEEDCLGLDTEACDGCGLCIPACPTGALHLELPWQIRSLGSNLVILFACGRSGMENRDGVIPCLHALGLRQLLLIHAAGIRYLLVCSGECGHCDRQPGVERTLERRLEQANRLLTERNQPPLRLLQRSAKAWLKLHASDEVIPRGTRLNRRDFLRGGGAQLSRQLATLSPLNRPESRTLPPGELLPSAPEEALNWPWFPRLDPKACNGCDACVRFCPTGALQLLEEPGEDEERPSLAYRVDPAPCTGCNLCRDTCDQKAIQVLEESTGKVTQVALRTGRCTACGNPFHEPIDHEPSSLCRICRERDFSRLLFQVID